MNRPNQQKHRELVIATGNPGKLKEFEQRFKHLNWIIRSKKEWGITDPEENGLSFVENALIKARHTAAQTNKPTLADDSGLEVDYLQGKPGIYSSRYAGTTATDDDNINKLLATMIDVPTAHRHARFCCLLVYVRHAEDPMPTIFQGTWEGLITTRRNGNSGFGYDPIFYIPKYQKTAAELTPMLKNTVSHRGQAMTKMIHFFNTSQRA